MKIDIYVSRVVTEKITVESPSLSEAVSTFNRNPENLKTSDGTVICAQFIDGDGNEDFPTWYPSMQPYEVHPTDIAIGPAERLARRLVKSNTIVSILAYDCWTPEDMAAMQESDIDEILATREYEESFHAFMEFIRLARRALDLPDQYYTESEL